MFGYRAALNSGESMEPWPTDAEITTARILGHEPKRGSCSCGFKVKSSGVMPKTQVANHIWMTIHHAKEARAERFGDKLCQPCKGSGENPFGRGECPSCHGVGSTSGIPRGQAAMIARDRNHEPISSKMCSCGSEVAPWERHAREVAAAVLQELEEFEKELRGDQ